MYRIQIARVGVQIAPGPEVTFMRRFDEWIPLWFNVALCRSETRTVLINTGFEAEVEHLRQAWLDWDPRIEFTREPSDEIGNVLDAFGVRPEEVDTVVLTPLGPYATGNVSLFRNADICVLKSGWARLMAPLAHTPRPSPTRAIPAAELTYMLGPGWDRIRFLEDEDEVAPGIRTHYAGVHHPSSMAILISTPRGTVCYSDSFFSFENVEGNTPVGIGRSTDEAYQTYARVRAEADLLLPAYDAAVFERYPRGLIE